ncbi:MAG TPA: hypothetical protein VNL14_03545 [Candidatus Acidoferrales bacterium]|nr:hypothetical protein [Candidatus Acidoferrales bacterium]
MAARKSGSNPPIGEDITFQRRFWIVERCFWVLLTGVVVLALGGFFGAASPTYAVAPAGRFRVAYERFTRYAAPTKLVCEFSDKSAGGELRIRINDAYAKAFKFEQIFPWPASLTKSGDDWVFSFSGDSRSPMRVTFYVKPEKIGALQARVAIDEAGTLTFRQFVYP